MNKKNKKKLKKCMKEVYAGEVSDVVVNYLSDGFPGVPRKYTGERIMTIYYTVKDKDRKCR